MPNSSIRLLKNTYSTNQWHGITSNYRHFVLVNISPKSDFLYCYFLAPVLEAMLAGGFIVISLLASIVNASVIPLSQSQITSFQPYTRFASAAYCTTLTWSCNGTSFLLVMKLHEPLKILYCVNNSGLRGELGLYPSSIRRQRWICAIL